MASKGKGKNHAPQIVTALNVPPIVTALIEKFEAEKRGGGNLLGSGNILSLGQLAYQICIEYGDVACKLRGSYTSKTADEVEAIRSMVAKATEYFIIAKQYHLCIELKNPRGYYQAPTVLPLNAGVQGDYPPSTALLKEIEALDYIQRAISISYNTENPPLELVHVVGKSIQKATEEFVKRSKADFISKLQTAATLYSLAATYAEADGSTEKATRLKSYSDYMANAAADGKLVLLPWQEIQLDPGRLQRVALE